MAGKQLSDVFIVAAKRTPFGAFGGKLAHLSATELGGLASKAAVAAVKGGSGNFAQKIDTVIFGNVLQTSADAAYLARHVGHRAGARIETPALTINRLCGSGFQAVMNGVHEIKLGEASMALVGGTESMSQSPYALRNTRWGTKYGQNLVLEDTLAQGLVDSYPTPTPMGITGENMGNKFGLTRKDCDDWAAESQKRWAEAHKKGVFSDEIAPVTIKDRKLGEVSMDTDEHPRPQTTAESLAKLKPVFKKDGLVTAGNASGINDGAGALLLASAAHIKESGVTPLARIVSYHVEGVEPSIMGYGPVPAIQKALRKANLSLSDMSLIEINEAFCAQFLGCAKELKLDLSKTNVSGGATAIGHPLGASGARILAHLTHRLAATGEKYAIGAACIGGGQGIAVVIENATI